MSIVRDEPWFWMGNRENPVAWLQRELKVRYQEGSEILQLSMRERNKEELKKSVERGHRRLQVARWWIRKRSNRRRNWSG